MPTVHRFLCSDGVFRYLMTEPGCLHCLTRCTCHGIMLRFHLRRTKSSFRLLTPSSCCSLSFLDPCGLKVGY